MKLVFFTLYCPACNKTHALEFTAPWMCPGNPEHGTMKEPLVVKDVESQD